MDGEFLDDIVRNEEEEEEGGEGEGENEEEGPEIVFSSDDADDNPLIKIF